MHYKYFIGIITLNNFMMNPSFLSNMSGWYSKNITFYCLNGKTKASYQSTNIAATLISKCTTLVRFFDLMHFNILPNFLIHLVSFWRNQRRLTNFRIFYVWLQIIQASFSGSDYRFKVRKSSWFFLKNKLVPSLALEYFVTLEKQNNDQIYYLRIYTFSIKKRFRIPPFDFRFVL